MRTLEETILRPLARQGPNGSGKALHELNDKLAVYRTDPDYPRLSQAVGVLQQALQERGKLLQKAQAGSQEQRASRGSSRAND